MLNDEIYKLNDNGMSLMDSYNKLGGKPIVNVISNSPEDWVNKTISTSTGNESNSSTRLIPVEQVAVKPSTTYEMNIDNDKYQFFNIHCYNSSGVWLGDRQYLEMPSVAGETNFVFTSTSETSFIKAVIRKKGDLTISPSDMVEVGLLLTEV